MTLWKPAPVPPSARKLYLRVYIAITTRLARKTADNSLLAHMNVSATSLQESAVEDRGADNFAVLNAVLRDCYHLEELVVELVVRGQETIFGQGLESFDRNQHTKAVAGLGTSSNEPVDPGWVGFDATCRRRIYGRYPFGRKVPAPGSRSLR
jgi:hypothetical protein